MAADSSYSLFIDHIKQGDLANTEACYSEEYLDYSDGDMMPIHHACYGNYLEIVTFLLGKKCNVDARNKNNETPLHIAASKGLVDVLQILVDHDCDVEAEDKNGLQAVHIASSAGHWGALEYLLDHKCDIESPDRNGLKVLHHIASEGHVGMLPYLLKRQCNMESETTCGWRAIHHASSKGHLDVLRWLLSDGRYIDAEDKNGWRAIHRAASAGHLDIVKYLVDHNCRMDGTTMEGWTPVHIAIKEGHFDVLKWLVDNNCDIEEKDKSARRAIHHAACKPNVNIMQYLLEKHCNKEAENEHKWRAIHYAASKGQLMILRCLADHNCDIEAADDKGRRPIHIAAYNGEKDILRYLIDRKCDIHATTSENQTALEIAKVKKKENCVELLENKPMDGGNTSSWVMADAESSHYTEAIQEEGREDTCLRDYDKGELVGSGGFGSVFKCHNRKTNHGAAMKVVSFDPSERNHPRYKALLNEIKVYSKLSSHARIVTYLGFIENKREMLIFMEYLSGGSLKRELSVADPLHCVPIARYTKQILEGLLYLHNMNVIHRDIKPANIMKDENGDLKLIDFGISRQLQTISQHTAVATTKCGTSHYMAPEIIHGERYTISADVWSLGITVWEMMTRNTPFHEMDEIAVIFKIANLTTMEYPPEIFGDLRIFLESALVIAPRQRLNVSDLLRSDFIQKGPRE